MRIIANLVLLLSLITGCGKPSGSKNLIDRVYRDEETTRIREEKIRHLEKIENSELMKLAKNTEYLAKRNPFSFSSEGPLSYNLSGIVWDEQMPGAIINGFYIKEGDAIGTKHVEKIFKDRVILTENGNKTTLLLQ